MPWLPGEPRRELGPEEQRARGRLLAEYHAASAGIEGLTQRPGWRRAEEILADPELDRVLAASEATRPEEVRIVRWHLERARSRAEGLRLHRWKSQPIHGDFTTWNLLFTGDRLTGLLDFELARNDHRVADFCLAWRGKYDAVIAGYEEVTPLEPEEREALTPIWWASLIEGACRDMRAGVSDDGWTLAKLLARSPLMGPDADVTP